jgi:hypothetical protein
MRVLVCGGRTLNHASLVNSVLDGIHRGQWISAIIHGGANGADAYADSWAARHGIESVEFKSSWKIHARSEVPQHNHRLLTDSRPDLVVAFPGGSKAEDMVKRAHEYGIQVVTVSVN